MKALEKYNEWLEKLDKDSPLYQDLLAIKDDMKEIEERFYQYITFGTAGLRGKLKAGVNCMNELMVGRATQGIANFIKEYGEEAMVEVQLNIVPEIFKNKGLFESGLKSNYSINLLTIKRKEETVAITKDTILQEKDIIVVFGPYTNIKNIFNVKAE